MKIKFLFFVSVLSVSGLIFSACLNNNQVEVPKKAEPEVVIESPPAVITSEQIQASYTFTATADGQTALELLEAATEIEIKKYNFGVFIESINGLAGNEKYFWAFKVNGEMANQGADQTKLKAGDVVNFEYKPIEIPET